MRHAMRFSAETELCAAFLARVDKSWTAYAETAGWDILLCRNSDGVQIGIQAKLRLNAAVLAQAIEFGHSYSAENAGPDYRAVLVPEGRVGDFNKIAGYIGITVLRMGIEQFGPRLPEHQGYYDAHWHQCLPARRHALPEYVPDVAAGASAPLQLTRWKIAAIKIAIILEKRGYVRRADFKTVGIDYRRWIAPGGGWLEVRDDRYVAGPATPNFKAQHPTVYEEIAAKAADWMPRTLELETA